MSVSLKIIKLLKLMSNITNKIDFANLPMAYEEHKVEIDNAIKGVLQNANYIMGEPVKEFEEKLQRFTGAKYAISCSSGTDALLLALMAMDIQPGDEVLTTPFTFIATAETIAFLKAKPVFVDIEESTYNIDPSKIEEKITARTKAIIPVSIFGQVPDMDFINEIAIRHDLFVIEDAAQSFGATYKGKRSCNLSTFACTSFFPAKPLGCFGDGGAVFTSEPEFATKMKSLRLHGQMERYHHKYIGMGGRLDTLQAAILNVKLDSYEQDISNRQRVAQKYTSFLKEAVIIPTVNPESTSVWAQYSIRVKNRTETVEKLKRNGIPTAIHYPKALHQQECFEYLDYKEGDFPVTEKVTREILSLPMNPYLTTKEIEFITNQLKTAIQ
ncbi:DegT/DnrJ/EryC1/StrS family aminotransferase [Salegentibacter salegens]|uniref:UDP-2-acetamido-2-deoxy-ribo-hexuluronate aminotransferase n=1 Tax=Salegentibacter salegens TaxID=143223 RepID=A0A1M7L5X8_9FLAO|nr:DegT/DnrJ/EryC1/StrS family aminotransferase [Salegentibacter salegens]PRX38730.1 UDP-2-acetamido-2-deoxy-ribo-hexuluronate aminotransferase [Salegentibacter salegens]SHM73140.1 UDP-2-acetamido-2-deoxy-ribo-hexuluronate aminotransferase [Salegentibacter salegens]